jgi:hypothetical protein
MVLSAARLEVCVKILKINALQLYPLYCLPKGGAR